MEFVWFMVRAAFYFSVSIFIWIVLSAYWEHLKGYRDKNGHKTKYFHNPFLH